MTATLTAPPAVAAPGTLADLILARMALPAKTSPAPSVVRTDVGGLLHGRPLSADEFAAARDGLASAGLVTVKGRSVRLTGDGRRRALKFLGTDELPPRTNWKTVQTKYLFPKAVGLSAETAGRLTTGDELAAFVLKRKYDLPTGSGASVKAALEALACRDLGYPDESTLEGLMRAVLSRRLGADERLTVDGLAAQFPLFETGLNSVNLDVARKTLVRAWLTAARPEPVPTAEPEPAAEFDLAAFAGTVLALARVRPPADRFHDNKVFIDAVWRASQREPGFPRMGLPEFKARLVDANRAGLLALSRADEVQSMPGELVSASETPYLNATFHFVLIQGDRP